MRKLKNFIFPLFMEEINKIETKYCNLIRILQEKDKKDNTKEKLKKDKDYIEYTTLRREIEERIFEIDEFMEQNFGQQFVIHFEKGKIKLQQLLLLTPDENLNSTKQAMFKNMKDIEIYKEIYKREKEKKKNEEREKLFMEPIYNKLPDDYKLYETDIEKMMNNKKKYYDEEEEVFEDSINRLNNINNINNINNVGSSNKNLPMSINSNKYINRNNAIKKMSNSRINANKK